jgi:hypothetical protein
MILADSNLNLSLYEMSDSLPYVLNGLIYLFLLDIVSMGLEMNISYENNMLQELLQICKFIGDIIM